MQTQQNESSIRSRARRKGYRVEKSRQREHLNNAGLYQLVDDRNCVVLGDRYDATLSEIAAYLNH